MKTILIVDDNLTNLKYISTQIGQEYKTILAKSGEQALQICTKQRPDLILLDIAMPSMDGFETISRIKQISSLQKIPVIFLTADHDVETEVKALQSGAMDFITKPVEKSILLHRIALHLQFSQYQQHLEDTVKELEDSIVTSFAELVEYRDQNTGGHIQRTSRYVELLGEALQEHGYFADELGSYEMALIVRASPMHDIGKIAISDTILLKPGRLTNEEFDVMRTHTSIGSDILKKMYERTPTQHYLQWAAEIAGSHHEKYDGTGYPLGIKGEEIPLCSRIMAVADVYDALVDDRVYRKAMSHEAACQIIFEGAGLHFDPKIVEVFKKIHEKFITVHHVG